MAGGLLWLVGRPVATDDFWWHLALGEQYAAHGPRLERDPLLYTTDRPPDAASWVFDVGLFGTERSIGFYGIRGLHVALVACIVWLVYGLFRRASGSSVAASLASIAFLSVAWYRLVQLRPGLVTILAVLLLYRLLAVETPPSWRRIAIAAAMVAVWANVHAAFLVGPLLLTAASGGALLAVALERRVPAPATETNRVVLLRLSASAALTLVAGLLNPRGPAQHLSFFTPSATPGLSIVVDEWSRFDPLAFGGAETRLGPLVWLLMDVLYLCVAALAITRAVRFLRRPDAESHRALDLVHLGLAGASLVAMAVAIRFQWLVVFPIVYLLRAARWQLARHPLALVWAGRGAVALCLALVPGFFYWSGYSLDRFGAPRRVAAYLGEPFSTSKYYSHAVWFLRDARLTGNLWGDYFMGGYLGYWLAPGIRSFINGTLNFPPEVVRDYVAVKQGRGARPGESLQQLLDRRDVDLFLGTGVPAPRDPALPRRYTTTLLEGSPEWLLVFRSLRSAVYLRRELGNDENLEKVRRYYAAAGLPFDPERGFDVMSAIRAQPSWATDHGLVPEEYARVVAASRTGNPAQRARAQSLLAELYLALGAYGRQTALDRTLLEREPDSKPALRRLAFVALRRGRPDVAEKHVGRLLQIDPSDAQTRSFEAILDEVSKGRHSAALRLPVLDAAEAGRLLGAMRRPAARRKGADLADPSEAPGHSGAKGGPLS